MPTSQRWRQHTAPWREWTAYLEEPGTFSLALEAATTLHPEWSLVLADLDSRWLVSTGWGVVTYRHRGPVGGGTGDNKIKLEGVVKGQELSI
jgi:hypothetical protein